MSKTPSASFIRWKFVLPVAVLSAALVVFFILFFDPLLARGLSKAGGKLNGARVDITGLKTKFFKGRLMIKNLQVSDRKDPMMNRVEAGPLVFQLDLGNILQKKVVIPEAKIEGIQFGTKRKTSGLLPKRLRKKQKDKDKKPGAAVKLVNKYKDRFKLNLDGLKGQVKKKIDFDPKELELTRQSDALKAKADLLPVEWKSKIENAGFEDRIKKVEADIKALEKTPTKGIEAITAIPKALKKLKDSKDELGQIKKDTKDLKQGLSKEIKALKSDVGNLKDAKKKDMKDLLKRMDLEFAEPDRLVEGLIGETLLERVQTALKYVEMAREHLPSKKEKEALPKKPRAEGMDIEFPKPASPPKLWLKEAVLAGLVKGLDVSGVLTSLTSDPPRVGKPMVLALKGTKGPQTFSAKVTVDHTGEVQKDHFVLEAKGLRLTELTSGGILGQALRQGSGNGSFTFMAIGDDQIGGDLKFWLQDLKFDDEKLLKAAGIEIGPAFSFVEAMKADFLKKVALSIEKMDKVTIHAQLFGTWEDPDIKLSSNLGPNLSRVIKALVGETVKDQKKALEAELNKLLKAKTSEVQAKLGGLTSRLDGNFSGLDKKIQSEINKAGGLNLTPTKDSPSGSPLKIPKLDDLFK